MYKLKPSGSLQKVTSVSIAELYELFKKYTERLFLTYSDLKGRYTFEDAIQDIITKISKKHPEGVEIEGTGRNYVKTVMKNHLLDILKSRSFKVIRKKEVELPMDRDLNMANKIELPSWVDKLLLPDKCWEMKFKAKTFPILKGEKVDSNLAGYRKLKNLKYTDVQVAKAFGVSVIVINLFKKKLIKARNSTASVS